MDPLDWLILCGDVTDNGNTEEYAEALRLFSPFGRRIFAVPGNHDRGVLGIFAWAGARRRWSKFAAALGCVPEQVIGNRLFIGLNSCLDTLWFGDLARGEVGKGQRAKMATRWPDQAAQLGCRLTYVLHHWPDCDDETLALDDKAEVLRLVEGRADLVAGHTHTRAERSVGGYTLRSIEDFRHASSFSWLDC